MTAEDPIIGRALRVNDDGTVVIAVRPIQPEDTEPPRCPKCRVPIQRYDDHGLGCENWGMLPVHWRDR